MKWSNDEGHRLVVDNGSWNFRAGLATLPKTYSCVNKVIQDVKTNKVKTIRNTDQFIDEVGSKFINMQIKGTVVDYVAYNAILGDMANSLDLVNEKRFLKNYSLTMSQPIFEPNRAICNHLEFLFELVGFGAVKFCKKGEGVFNSTSNYSGIVIDLGHSSTSIIPVFADKVIKNAYRRLDIGGKMLTKCLMDNISTTQFKINKHFFTGTNIKEELCYVYNVKGSALKDRIEKKDLEAAFYLLPDYTIQKKGRAIDKTYAETRIKDVIKLDSERVIIPEILFNPSM